VPSLLASSGERGSELDEEPSRTVERLFSIKGVFWEEKQSIRKQKERSRDQKSRGTEIFSDILIPDFLFFSS
jgi:hypothetical protein